MDREKACLLPFPSEPSKPYFKDVFLDIPNGDMGKRARETMETYFGMDHSLFFFSMEIRLIGCPG